jgi:hypothetical protein
MSFYVLGSEPVYNYVSNTYRWSFYNTFDLQQYQQCTGEVRYALSVNFKNNEVVYTTQNEAPTEVEIMEIEKIVIKRLWHYFNNQAVVISENLEAINTLAQAKWKGE